MPLLAQKCPRECWNFHITNYVREMLEPVIVWFRWTVFDNDIPMTCMCKHAHACVCVCVFACVRARACVCVCVFM